jgi:hypothetical protein
MQVRLGFVITDLSSGESWDCDNNRGRKFHKKFACEMKFSNEPVSGVG